MPYTLGPEDGPWLVFSTAFPFFIQFKLTPTEGWDDAPEPDDDAAAPPPSCPPAQSPQ